MTERRDAPTVATHAPPSGETRTRAPRPSISGQLGRYTIVKLLGRGGVGAVYEAHDPELDRRVAIKLLREDRDDTEGLRREAQALARLVHRNVVMVYDVGDAGDEVFLVMQLVEGKPIDVWLAEHPSPPETIIAMFRQAAEGLIAAHAAGLVHCDFKPGNVLVDAEGTVRVSDFGLARASRTLSRAPEAGESAVGMTTIAGTPAYMAPEQFTGTVTAASDQFAFCVALWECLTGERPFEDSTAAATATTLDARLRGARRPLGRDADMPAHVMRALERGMAEDPAQRFPTMRALVDALAPRVRWRRIAGIAGATVLVGGVAAFVIYELTRTPPPWNGADVANAQQLTSFGREACAYAPAFEPGGKQVVFDRTAGDAVDLYAVPIAGGAPRALTSAATWEWRAQPGRVPGEVSFLIHDQAEPMKSQIAYLDLATGKQTIALGVFAWDAATIGDALYYSPDASAGIRMLKGKEDRSLVEPSSEDQYFLLAGSPGRDRLVTTQVRVNGGKNQICFVAVATAKTECIADRDTLVRPVFGTGGTTLYYANYDGVVRRELATGAELVIIKDVYVEGGLAIAPDGKNLVYSTCYAHTQLIDISTGKVMVDHERVADPAIASTGALAWVRNVRGTNVLVVRTPDGRELQLTREDLGSVASPQFSPDGKQVVFATTKPSPGIRYANLERVGELQQLTSDPRDSDPAWSTGNLIAYSKSDTSGNEHVHVTNLDGAQVLPPTTATRSVYGSRGAEFLLAGPTAMYWLDPRTGTERPGPPRPEGFLNNASTSPSGNWVVYSLGSTGQQIWRVRVDPIGELELVKTFPSGITVETPAIRDDGQVIAIAGKYYGDLVRVPARSGSRF